MTRLRGGRLLAHPVWPAIVRLIGVALLGLVLSTSVFGTEAPLKNLAPTFVWVIWWVGLAFVSALLGNLWPLLNPWSNLIAWAHRVVPRGAALLRREGALTYPTWLGVWPCVFLFIVFAWTELVSDSSEAPRTLACLILGYTALTWSGMALFGRRTWLNNGEVFTRFFDVLGRLAPLHGRQGCRATRLWLRPYGAGLVTEKPVGWSMTVFVIAMLSTVTFDGFVETPVWAGFLEWLTESRTMRPLLLWMQGQGVDLLKLAKTLALVLFPPIFLLVFLTVCAMAAKFGKGQVDLSEMAGTQVMSLVPIAVAYHVAHYLSYLLLAGQLIIPLASDPFGWGWDLFGTADRTIDITIINTRMVWYTAIVAIVAGHMLAVYLAHVMALMAHRERRLAVRSQIPMLLLMVFYTMTSLWILSQPIVER